MSEQILRFLVYFDLFLYPLTKVEIASYIGVRPDQTHALDEALNALLFSGTVRFSKGFYFVNLDDSIIERRIRGNERAIQRMATARRNSRIIALFPYVRAVFLSGSISKGFMGENDDIDYFIITSPGRIWLTRSLLTLYKKIFLFNSYKNFCINYLVSSDKLATSAKNIYAATEIVFLLPTVNLQLYLDFLEANTWVKKYYPTFQQDLKHIVKPKAILKPAFEWILNNRFGNCLENRLYHYSIKVITNRYSFLKNQAFEQSFSLTKDEIKYFPIHSKLNIMERYQERIRAFSTEKHIHFMDEIPSRQES